MSNDTPNVGGVKLTMRSTTKQRRWSIRNKQQQKIVNKLMFLMEQSGQTPDNSKIKQKHTPGQSEQPNRQPHPKWRFGKGILLKWPWFRWPNYLGLSAQAWWWSHFSTIFSGSFLVCSHPQISGYMRIPQDVTGWLIELWHMNSTWKELTWAHKQRWWNMVNRPFLY